MNIWRDCKGLLEAEGVDVGWGWCYVSAGHSSLHAFSSWAVVSTQWTLAAAATASSDGHKPAHLEGSEAEIVKFKEGGWTPFNPAVYVQYVNVGGAHTGAGLL